MVKNKEKNVEDMTIEELSKVCGDPKIHYDWEVYEKYDVEIKSRHPFISILKSHIHNDSGDVYTKV